MQATVIVHWPGKDTAACPGHALKLRSLGMFMAGMVPLESPCEDDRECDNCRNEKAKESD